MSNEALFNVGNEIDLSEEGAAPLALPEADPKTEVQGLTRTVDVDYGATSRARVAVVMHPGRVDTTQEFFAPIGEGWEFSDLKEVKRGRKWFTMVIWSKYESE